MATFGVVTSAVVPSVAHERHGLSCTLDTRGEAPVRKCCTFTHALVVNAVCLCGPQRVVCFYGDDFQTSLLQCCLLASRQFFLGGLLGVGGG